MRSTKTREYLKYLAKEHNLTMEEVRRVVESPFQFVKYVMENETDRESLRFPSIRIPFFGLIHSPDYVKNKYKDKNK